MAKKVLFNTLQLDCHFKRGGFSIVTSYFSCFDFWVHVYMQYASPINSSLSQLLSHLRALVLSPTNLTDLSVMVRLTGADWSGSERSSWPCCCCCGSTARSSCWGSPRTIYDNSPSLQERHLFIFSHISYIRHTCSMVLQLHAGLLGLVSIACVLGFGGNNFWVLIRTCKSFTKKPRPKDGHVLSTDAKRHS